jgi:hypothetical protein
MTEKTKEQVIMETVKKLIDEMKDNGEARSITLHEPCAGIMGRIFGHNFNPRHTGENDQIYVADICDRCGKVAHGKLEPHFLDDQENETEMRIRAKAETQLHFCDDLLAEAWGVIANVNRGRWGDQSKEWVEAAERWRDKWFQESSQRRTISNDIVTPAHLDKTALPENPERTRLQQIVIIAQGLKESAIPSRLLSEIKLAETQLNQQ